MRRLISNIEATAADDGELVAESNFALAELAIQAKREMHWWVGRTTHRLRRVGGELKMCRKTVVLVNAAEPLPNLSFLIWIGGSAPPLPPDDPPPVRFGSAGLRGQSPRSIGVEWLSFLI